MKQQQATKPTSNRKSPYKQGQPLVRVGGGYCGSDSTAGEVKRSPTKKSFKRVSLGPGISLNTPKPGRSLRRQSTANAEAGALPKTPFLAMVKEYEGKTTDELYKHLKAYCQAALTYSEEVEKRRQKELKDMDREMSSKHREEVSRLSRVSREELARVQKENTEKLSDLNGKLQQRESETRTEVAELNKNLTDLKIKKAQLVAENSRMKNEIEKKGQTIGDRDSEIKALKEDLTKLKARAMTGEARGDRLQKELNKTTADLAKLQKKYDNDIENWEERYSELEQQEEAMVALLLKRSNKRKESRSVPPSAKKRKVDSVKPEKSRKKMSSDSA